jgi:hypothetical protein
MDGSCARSILSRRAASSDLRVSRRLPHAPLLARWFA